MYIQNQKFQRKEKIVQREIGGETLLIPINQTGADLQRVFVLNDTALSVWQKIESPQTIETLTTSLKDEFDGNAKEIKAHVEELIGDLAELDLIEIAAKG